MDATITGIGAVVVAELRSAGYMESTIGQYEKKFGAPQLDLLDVDPTPTAMIKNHSREGHPTPCAKCGASRVDSQDRGPIVTASRA